MTISALPEVDLRVENPDWVGDGRGGFHVVPMSVSERELALPDDEWRTIRDLYVDGMVAHARRCIGAWYDEQRTAV